MYILVGLGNPEKKYELTRHNLGFILVDKIAETHGCNFSFDKKLNSEVGSCVIKKKKVVLLKPQTFVNKSGEAVVKAKNYFKVSVENIIVIHDDLDIEFGKIKYSFDSSSAGHRGIESVMKSLRTKKFHRIKVGIRNKDLDKIKSRTKDKERKKELVGNFVLSQLGKNEKNKIKDLSSAIIDKLESGYL